MTTRINTGGSKDFVYTGKEKYEDTEPTRQFKKHYRGHLNRPKWKRRLFKYKPPKEAKVVHEQKPRKTFPITPFIYFTVLIVIALVSANGIVKLINSESFDNAMGKVSRVKRTLFPSNDKKEIIEDVVISPVNITKEPTLPKPPTIDEEIFERKDEAKQAFEYTINEFRREEDIDELEWSDHAYNLAVFRAKDLLERDYFEHVTPEGLTVDDYMEEFGLDGYAGENIGGMAHYPNEEVSGSVREVIRQWMVSVGHKQNLLNKRYNLGAVGCYKYICTFIGVNGDEVTPIKKSDDEIEEEIVEEDSGEYVYINLRELSSTIQDYVGKKVETTGKMKRMSPDGLGISSFFALADKDGLFVYAKKPESIMQILYWDKTYTIKGVVRHREREFNVIELVSEAYWIEADQPLER